MMVLPNMHGVNNFLKDLANEHAYMVVLITIRMNSQDNQNEGFVIRCEKCNELVYRRETNIKCMDRSVRITQSSMRLASTPMRLMSSTPRLEYAPSVSHVQELFPDEQVGWRRYAQQVAVANRARTASEQRATRDG